MTLPLKSCQLSVVSSRFDRHLFTADDRLLFVPEPAAARDLFHRLGDLAFVFGFERDVGDGDDAGKTAVASTTGSRRTCLSPIRRIASKTKSSGLTEKISVVIASPTGEEASVPRRCDRTTMSRSVTIPTSLPSSTTGTEPISPSRDQTRRVLQRHIARSRPHVRGHYLPAPPPGCGRTPCINAKPIHLFC